MTDLPPNPDELDEGEQANDAAAAIAGFTLAQFAFGELIKNGILPKDHAEQMLRYAIETHATAGPGNRGAAEMVTVNASISFGRAGPSEPFRGRGPPHRYNQQELNVRSLARSGAGRQAASSVCAVVSRAYSAGAGRALASRTVLRAILLIPR